MLYFLKAMKKYLALILILIAIVVFYTLSGAGSKNSPDSNTSVSKDGSESTGVVEQKDATRSEKYLVFGDGVIESQNAKKRVLFFYANWCPTCRPVDTELKASESKIPDGAVVIRVNYNDSETDAAEKELADKYGITYQHTFVLLDRDGGILKKWNGGSLKEILANI